MNQRMRNGAREEKVVELLKQHGVMTMRQIEDVVGGAKQQVASLVKKGHVRKFEDVQESAEASRCHAVCLHFELVAAPTPVPTVTAKEIKARVAIQRSIERLERAGYKVIPPPTR